MQDPKETNPKMAIGVSKIPMSCVPTQVVQEIALGMMEGGLKYGRHNYRLAGCRTSVYYDAAMRHLMAFWEGQDVDPDSGLPHVSKAMASLAVLRDCQIAGNAIDDRPPTIDSGFADKLNALAKELVKRYPDPKPAFTIADTKK